MLIIIIAIFAVVIISLLLIIIKNFVTPKKIDAIPRLIKQGKTQNAIKAAFSKRSKELCCTLLSWKSLYKRKPDRACSNRI